MIGFWIVVALIVLMAGFAGYGAYKGWHLDILRSVIDR